MSTINVSTRFRKNGSDTIVTFIGTESRDGVLRARFQAAHGGIVSLTMQSFLERYTELAESESVPVKPAKTPLQLVFGNRGMSLTDDGRILDGEGYSINCPPDLADLYIAEFPLKPLFANGDDIHDVFINYRPGSCMGYDRDEHHEMRMLYVNNSDIVSTVYLEGDSNYLLCGPVSALVWHTDKYLWIDRIYNSGYRVCGMEDKLRYHLRRACELRWPDREFVKPMSIDVEHDVDRPLPYIDTFHHAEDIGGGMVRLNTTSNSRTVTCTNTGGTYIEPPIKCCCCSSGVNEDEYHSNDCGDIYCEECWGDNYSIDEITQEWASIDDLATYKVYCSDGRVRELFTTTYSLDNNHSRCHDDSVVEYVYDRHSIETHDDEYLCPDDMETGDWVETVEGDVMAIDDAYFYDYEWHTEEQETPEDMPEDDDDDDLSPIVTDPNDIFIDLQTNDGVKKWPAYKVGDCLAVHICYTSENRLNHRPTWNVTQIATGLAVYVCLDSRREAIDKATKLLASLAIGGIANGMITTTDPNRPDPYQTLAQAVANGITDRTTRDIYRNCDKEIDFSVLATV